MIESLLSQPECDVREAEYLRLLGYPPGHELGDRQRELADWARRWYRENGRPWVYLREAALELGGGSVLLDGREFASPRLHAHLREGGCRRVVLMAASAGAGCEEAARVLWQDAKPDEYFFLEVFGSSVVEHLVAATSGRICGLAEADGEVAIPHYSPGYSGWDVAEQNRLHELIFQGSSVDLPEPLEVLSSGMLRPKKSLLAVFGITRRASAPSSEKWVPCRACAFSPCQYRRSAYRHSPEQRAAAAAPAAAYSVNPRALEKWAGERLTLTRRDDGRIDAVFRFDGTTCSNLGHPLAFEYRLLIGSPGENRRILGASCSPAAGDLGYQKMCAHLADAEGLLAAIATEKPLLGRPLGDVLSWQRTPAPAGCLCTQESRAHKWGLALEVIHHSLAGAASGGERPSEPRPVPSPSSP